MSFPFYLFYRRRGGGLVKHWTEGTEGYRWFDLSFIWFHSFLYYITIVDLHTRSPPKPETPPITLVMSWKMVYQNTIQTPPHPTHAPTTHHLLTPPRPSPKIRESEKNKIKGLNVSCLLFLLYGINKLKTNTVFYIIWVSIVHANCLIFQLFIALVLCLL